MPRYSYLSHLECSRCTRRHSAQRPQGLCRDCQSPLLARYDLRGLSAAVPRNTLAERSWSMWRYHELLPGSSPHDEVHLGEVVTPLLKMRRVAAQIGLRDLWVKDESAAPTSTFKARGAAVGVSRARELGLRALAMPTNGNAGAAWSAYAARAQIPTLIVMPQGAPTVTRAECLAVGAEVQLVDGLISDAAATVAAAVKESGRVDVGTLKEPYRVEGKKTMGLEIVEQLGWALPDVIVYPTGGGVGLIGMHKAITELLELGWVQGEMPRFVAVQSSGCAPVVDAFSRGLRECRPWPDARTVAFGINVPKPLGDYMILDALYKSHGRAVEVSDADLIDEVRTVGSQEGIFLCPEGAATIAAVRQFVAEHWIERDDRVVVLNTGSGNKYPEALDSTLTYDR